MTAAINGYLYVYGGTDVALSSTCWGAPINPDGTLGGWRTMAPLPLPAYGCGAAGAEGHAYAMGGYINPSGTIVVDSCTVYVAATDGTGQIVSWSLGTPLPQSRGFGWAAADM
jgi:hypothetical protein